MWIQRTLPYKLSVPMPTGDKVKFTGTMTSSGFGVNLHDAAGNIMFHFNPRSYGTVARNVFLNAAWGAEETTGSFPFTVGVPYVIVIERSNNGFLVTVDGVRKPDLDFTQARASIYRRGCGCDRLWLPV